MAELTKENRIKAVGLLMKEYPDAKCALDYDTPYHLLVAVMLSAQATDVSVNKATPALFAAAKDAGDMVKLSQEELEGYIRKIGMYHIKAANILKMSAMLIDRYGGEVPGDFDSLTALPGVGRKTANVMLSEVFGQQRIAVDTHVFRLANRIGFTAEKNVLGTELSLMKRIPEDKRTAMHHALILHGRKVCTSRAPKCWECVLNGICRKNM